MAVAAGCGRTARAEVVGALRGFLVRDPHVADALQLLRRLLRRHRDRGISTAFILPVILRYRMKDLSFEPGAWSLGQSLQVDRLRSQIFWVFFISIVFLMPPYTISAPWKDGFTWEAVNYAPILLSPGALLLFGGWWVLSAKNWFEPRAHGHRGALERLEEERIGDFVLRPRRVGRRTAPVTRGARRRLSSCSGLERATNAGRPGRPAQPREVLGGIAAKSKSSSDTAACTTPHIASRKSDMNRMSSSAPSSSARTSPT